MRLTPALVLVILSALVLPARPAHAWSNKEHLQLTRIAALRLIAAPDTPADMKAWLREIMPGVADMAAEREFFLTARVGPYPVDARGVSFWATVPDLDVATSKPGREDKIEPFDAPERLMHYIDIEFFNPVEAKRVYADDLSTKP